MFSFLNEFPQIFAEKLYDEPNIDSKVLKQGSQGKKGVTHYPSAFYKIVFSISKEEFLFVKV